MCVIMLKVHAESTQTLKKCFGQEVNKEEQLIKAIKVKLGTEILINQNGEQVWGGRTERD